MHYITGTVHKIFFFSKTSEKTVLCIFDSWKPKGVQKAINCLNTHGQKL